jgi:hypothetical protein
MKQNGRVKNYQELHQNVKICINIYHPRIGDFKSPSTIGFIHGFQLGVMTFSTEKYNAWPTGIGGYTAEVPHH